MRHELLYKAIFYRKSVRKFREEPLAADKLELITQYTENIEPLFEDVQAEIRMLDAPDVSSGFAVKAPHYAAIYTGTGKRAMLDAGYRMQQLNLCLATCGLGSCYLGMAKPRERGGGELSYAIMLAFGTPAEEHRRGDVSQFTRKAAAEICSAPLPGEITEAVRLAPSAINLQPWLLTGTADTVFIWRKKTAGAVSLMVGKLHYIDMGISLCHLMVGARQAGLGCRFNFEAEAPANPPKGCELICSAGFSPRTDA